MRARVNLVTILAIWPRHHLIKEIILVHACANVDVAACRALIDCATGGRMVLCSCLPSTCWSSMARTCAPSPWIGLAAQVGLQFNEHIAEPGDMVFRHPASWGSRALSLSAWAHAIAQADRRARHLPDRHSNARAISLKTETRYVAATRETMMSSRTGSVIFCRSSDSYSGSLGTSPSPF